MPITKWDDYVELVRPWGSLVERAWDPSSERTQAELNRQFLMNLSLGYLMMFAGDPERPDFVPYLNSAYLLQPNPDDTYYYAVLNSAGTYRISGDRGSVHLLTLSVGWRMIGMSETRGGRLGEYNLGDMTPLDGTVDVLLSREKPQDYDGDWCYLDPRSEYIIVRQRSYRWGEERDARLAIQRLDPIPRRERMPVAEIDRRMREAIGYAERFARQWLDFHAELKASHPVNEFHFQPFAQFAAISAQVYWEAIFELGPDEALILETDVPQKVRYWNVQTNDQIWNAVDYIARQSSLNGVQARLDPDGKFRAVVTMDVDPGVPNWIDTGGHETGTLIGRWYEADAHPLPTLKRVPLGEVRKHIHPDTPHMAPDARRESLMHRERGAQMRRRW